MPVSDIDWIHPICERFIAGAQGLGMPRNPDYNGATQAGVGYFQRTISGRWRMSTARTYLRPARSRSNLSVCTNSRALSVVFEGKRAVGVRYVKRTELGTAKVVSARREGSYMLYALLDDSVLLILDCIRKHTSTRK